MSRSAIALRFRRLAVVAMLVVVSSLLATREASAQVIISPFLGYNFGGDAGCPEITGCSDKNLNWGASIGAVGRIVGMELEFGYADNFFGESNAFKSNVLTVTGNFLLAPRFGPVQPYGAIGLGLIKAETDLTSSSLVDTSINDFGWDVGGGLMVFFGKHVGARGDLRYFHSFQARQLIGLQPTEEKLDFGRLAGGIVFRF
jgi:opacity protein-like surface antigen